MSSFPILTAQIPKTLVQHEAALILQRAKKKKKKSLSLHESIIHVDFFWMQKKKKSEIHSRLDVYVPYTNKQ